MVLDAFDASNDDRKSILSSKDVRTLFSFIATHLAKLAKEDRKQTAIRGLEELWLSWQEHLEGETNGNAESTKQVLSEVRDWFSTFVDEKETSLLNAIFRCLLKRRGYLRNRIEAPRFKKDAPADGVVLSTMHGAKGLEFDHVWAIGLDASDEDKMDPDVIEEERRLVYVAFTRAKNRLVTSYVTSNKPSMFLREAGLVLERAPRKRTRRAVYGKPA
jgi:superfamily I DNA/RNA helicase